MSQKTNIQWTEESGRPEATESMTQEQYRLHLSKKKKRSLYGSIKTVIDGITFDSKKEAAHYGQLKIRERAGEITDLVLQPEFQIDIKGMKIASYFADFEYKVNGQRMVIDVKSRATRKKAVYRLKKKAVEQLYGIQIIEV